MTYGRSPVVTEVADDVFAYVQPEGGWFVNNTGFLAARDGITSIDTCATAARTLAYLDTVQQMTHRTVRTVVNTHHHGDHTYGNSLVPHATVVGHTLVREALLRWGSPPPPRYWRDDVEWGELHLAPPSVTYEHGIRLHLDRFLCEVTYVGMPAHTVSDSIVWLPEAGVLFAGDLLFNGSTPLMSHGSIAGALIVLDQLAALGADTIVPGHGPVGGPSMIDDVRRYLHLVQRVAAAGADAGVGPLEAARACDLGEFSELVEPERIVANLHRAYAELAGAAPGARIDVDAAFSDMVELNGGRPLACEV